ncbi:MAG TPA: CPBP family intramembrane metalloprotease, partial [bacterium]|nr:CPBP family intramembrane metalloprotease [bacterium]
LIFLTLLLRDKSFDRKKLWLPDGFLSNLMPVLVRLIAGGILLSIILKIRNPDLLFNFMKSEPRIWIMVMILYPLVSVYPQEIIYRAYFFHRYKPLFPHPRAMITASGLCFGLVHIFFFNAWALTLSTIGGIMFAWTYHRSGSILFSSIEHGLWGDFIFTIGLGLYFYGGAI